MKKKWFTVLLIYLALIAVCLVVVYAVPSVKSLMIKTYVTEYGTVDVVDSVTGYIVRDETVYAAAEDCYITRKISEDELVKAKTTVVELDPMLTEEEVAAIQEQTENKAAGTDVAEAGAGTETSGKSSEDAEKDLDSENGKSESGESESGDEAPEEEPSVTRRYRKIIETLGDTVWTVENGKCQQAGYVSYSVDGAEKSLTTSRVDDLKKSRLEKLTSQRSVETPNRKCRRGDPVFKIIHNSKWYLVFWVENKLGDKYVSGKIVNIRIGDENYRAAVYDAVPGKKETRVTLTCKMFTPELLHERKLKTEVTSASAEGLIIRDSSIVEKGGQKGVLVKNKLGEHRFKPISIKADDGQRSAVYSDIYVDADGNYVETVKTYDEIVAEPSEEDLQMLRDLEEKEKADAARAEQRKQKQEKAAEELEAAARKAEAELRAREEAEGSSEAGSDSEGDNVKSNKPKELSDSSEASERADSEQSESDE